MYSDVYRLPSVETRLDSPLWTYAGPRRVARARRRVATRPRYDVLLAPWPGSSVPPSELQSEVLLHSNCPVPCRRPERIPKSISHCLPMNYDSSTEETNNIDPAGQNNREVAPAEWRLRDLHSSMGQRQRARTTGPRRGAERAEAAARIRNIRAGPAARGTADG